MITLPVVSDHRSGLGAGSSEEHRSGAGSLRLWRGQHYCCQHQYAGRYGRLQPGNAEEFFAMRFSFDVGLPFATWQQSMHLPDFV